MDSLGKVCQRVGSKLHSAWEGKRGEEERNPSFSVLSEEGRRGRGKKVRVKEEEEEEERRKKKG